ncbi:MAG: phosphatase PAP2 family protein [Prevotella sp.]|nr:phosphatase PAP2 family protein [Prevotella sp.]
MKRLLALILLVAPALLTHAQQHRGDAFDNLMQHAPMATVFVLKACDVENHSSWGELAVTAVASYAIAAATTYSLKQVIAERRPDHSDRRSFPSGHATFAFAGATTLYHEFGHVSPWVTIGGYGVATLTAVDRIVRDRHYLHDVCAGAAIGFAATELTYYLRRQLFKTKDIDLSFTGQTVDLAIRW